MTRARQLTDTTKGAALFDELVVTFEGHGVAIASADITEDGSLVLVVGAAALDLRLMSRETPPEFPTNVIPCLPSRAANLEEEMVAVLQQADQQACSKRLETRSWVALQQPPRRWRKPR